MLHLSTDLKILLASILIGFITFRKTHSLYLKLFPLFLLLIMVVELTGQLLNKPRQNNIPLFNLFSVIEFSFFIYFFREVTISSSIKKRINFLLILFPLLCLINIFFIQGPKTFHTYTYVLGSLLMVGLGVFYFYQLFKSTVHVNLIHEPSFWISTGILFFFTCSVSIMGIINYISVLSKAIIQNSHQVLLSVNSLFYTLFIIAFICQINIRKFIPSSWRTS